MYLDPGSAGMAVQAFFGLCAAILMTLRAPRETFTRLWRRIFRRKEK